MIYDIPTEKLIVVIPAYNPDKRLIQLVEEIRALWNPIIIIIDDGSKPDVKWIFAKLETVYSCDILSHAHNKGKGAALKTAANYIVNTYPKNVGYWDDYDKVPYMFPEVYDYAEGGDAATRGSPIVGDTYNRRRYLTCYGKTQKAAFGTIYVDRNGTPDDYTDGVVVGNNACYKAGRTITPKGIMVHSTGANNPCLKRYVGPDDGLLGKNQYNNHWNQDKPDGRQVCVHGFIGKLADGSVATYQTLPWNHRGWHCGSGSKGSGNDTHISFECCEDGLTDKAYFEAVYREAAELCAYLCKEYSLDPTADGVIIGHYEGYQRGIASNHGDPQNWWPKHGKTMIDFRAYVKQLLEASIPAPSTPPTTGKTPIMGESVCTAAQLNAYVKKNNPNAPELGAIFIEEGDAEGVRGDVAFCQSCLETGFFKFGGDVSAVQNNFCGLGATGGGVKGASFTTPRDGIRAQIQHLKAYASKDALKNSCIDPRFNLVTRGIAPNWEDLNGRWAVPGNGYGENIIKLWNAAKSTAAPSAPASAEPPAFTPYLVKVTASVAAAAYRSGDKLTNEYDGMQFSYSDKKRIVHTEILLPEHAPREYLDRSTLWNGTYNLQTFTLQLHRAEDYITKIARVRYDQRAKCARWECFIDEIMCGDKDTATFLQKALGYALTGDTNAHNSFYILYGASTRNGKSTLTEAIGYILGDYSRTVQPQTLARRSSDGAAPSPDIARLKGARFVCTPEPEKGLELNSALIKQLTGGDTYVGRFLNENPFEFVPEFHIFFNTNHLPRTNDDTIFASGRVKIIPFERHFTDKEQDHGLKGLFRKNANKSAILNWLIDGYRQMLKMDMNVSARMQTALDEYRAESDVLGGFFAEKIAPAEGKRLQTSALYAAYTAQMRLCGSRPMSVQAFVGEVKKRYQVGRDRKLGTVIFNAALSDF
ncbi:hypothetical protein FACS1894217_05360 [Clostridia bacterium]|nr:hypothetical protein FACS1894217_05360 [Clostridia bacterium]